MIGSRCLSDWFKACALVPILLFAGQAFMGFPNSFDFQSYGLEKSSADALSYFLFLNLFFLLTALALSILVAFGQVLILAIKSSGKEDLLRKLKIGTGNFIYITGLLYGLFVVLFLFEIHKTGVDFLNW